MRMFLTLVVAVLVVYGDASGQQEKVTDAGPGKFVAKTPSKFQFGGGDLGHFLSEVRTTFGVDLELIGTVPESMLHGVRVPKLRMGGEGERLDFRNVLNLYNQISAEGDPSMGRWIIKGEPQKEPEAIMLVATGPRAEASFTVKAFAIATEEPGEAHSLIYEIVEKERTRISMLIAEGVYQGVAMSDLSGQLQAHSRSGILVASGGKVYVELVAAIVEAYKQKNQMKDITVPATQEAKTR